MKPFEKLIKWLKISGLWKVESSSKYLAVIAVILHIVFVEFFLIFGIICFVNVKDIVDFSEINGVLPLYVITFIKSLHFLYNKNKIELMLKDLKELIEQNSWIEKQNGSKLKQRIRKIDDISQKYVAVVMTAVFMTSLVPLFTHKLPLKMWFPYDFSNNETLFWLSVLYQNIASYCVVPMQIIIEMFPIYLMNYLTGIIEELSERMGKICEVKIVKIKSKSEMTFNEKLKGRSNDARRQKTQKKAEPKAGTSQTFRDKKDENLEELLKCIKIQQKIENLVADVNDVFGRIIWFQGFMTSFILASSAFLMTVVSFEALKAHKFVEK
jgi:7tm Odorant receptor